jgi:single-strand selective monofunctional uracil DNA glycosylase
MTLAENALQLREDLRRIPFTPPVSHVYDPLDYAWAAHSQYLQRYGGGQREIVLVGMNPGPWGMAQTGVPFGDVEWVRDWLGIAAPVAEPSSLHPKRPVQGFACKRREGSGRRLWGWAAKRFGTADAFFARFFVANYCPLCFFDEAGANITPDKLAALLRKPLEAACDAALRRTVETLQPRRVLGIGRFAERRVAEALAGTGVAVGGAPHPSPASPQANRGWERLMEEALRANGVDLSVG